MTSGKTVLRVSDSRQRVCLVLAGPLHVCTAAIGTLAVFSPFAQCLDVWLCWICIKHGLDEQSHPSFPGMSAAAVN